MQNNQQNNKENNQNIQNIQTNNGQRIVVNFVPGTGRRILQPTNQAPHRQPLQYTYQWPHGQQPPRPQFQQPPQQLQHPLRWQIQGQGHLTFPQRPPSPFLHQQMQPIHQQIHQPPSIFQPQIPQQQPPRQGFQVQQQVSSDFKRQKVSTASNVIKIVQVGKQPQKPVIIVSIFSTTS